jgi:hypothetical protein
MLKQEHEMSNVMQNFAMKNKNRNSVQPKMIVVVCGKPCSKHS